MMEQINSDEKIENLEGQMQLSNSIDVYCAWCKQFLYVSNGFYKKNHKASHGICKDCAEKIFKIIL